MRLRDFITELTLPQSTAEAGNILSNAGYEPVSAGLFGTVWSRRGDPFVLKLFTSQDNAYLSFIQLAQSKPNQHFPIFRGKPMRVSPQFFAVRIERLRPVGYELLPLVNMSWRYVGALSLLDHYRGTSHGIERLRGMNEQLTVVRAYRAKFPSLAQAFDQIYEFVIKGNPDAVMADIKHANLMRRGRTIVIADPVGSASMDEDPEVNLAENPTRQDLENIEHDKAAKRKPDMRKMRPVAMPGNTSAYPAL